MVYCYRLRAFNLKQKLIIYNLLLIAFLFCMPDNIPSIEDLISSSQGEDDDGGAQSKLAAKEQEIKKKEIERQAEQSAAQMGLPYVNLVGFPISPEALALLEQEQAEKLETVCFYYDGNDLRLASTKPDSRIVQEFLAKLSAEHYCQGKLYLISEQSLNYAMDYYRKLPKAREVIRGIKISEDELSRYSDQISSFVDLQKQINKIQLTETVTVLLAAAIKSGASDIHVEAEEKIIKVRFRIDGVLHDALDLKKDLWRKIISRMKLLAGVKINIADKPQDGRMTIYLKTGRIDIRVSFLPTAYGESVVMRILHSKSVGLAFNELGIRDRAFKQLKKEIERPNGMIITTGPTGSGKTTTLYAILTKLNKEDTKIITIEDPIEYQLEGINQSQASAKYTFAQGLRSIVRQDPDVIMVGEVRDLETAEIAIQAALTGHLVLSTIHTNDASGTVPRLLSMGAKPFLIAPAINAMIGQRLVRKICQECKHEDKPDEESLKRAKETLLALPPEEQSGINFEKLKFYKSKGCAACQFIGYKGRVGIYEIMTMNKDIEMLIISGKVSEYDMKESAIKNGMVTMVQDGLLKALEGITSLEEVFRVAE